MYATAYTFNDFYIIWYHVHIETLYIWNGMDMDNDMDNDMERYGNITHFSNLVRIILQLSCLITTITVAVMR